MTTITHTTQAGAFAAQLFDADGQSLAVIDRTPDPAMASETARRLAACWNACIDVPTDLLEQNHAPFSALRAERDHFEQLAKDNGSVIIRTACDLGEMTAQRDALFLALSETWRVLDSAGGLHRLATGVQLGPTVWAMKAHDARELSMKAIAATKPQPTQAITTHPSGCGGVGCNFVEIEPFGSRCTVCNFTIPF